MINSQMYSFNSSARISSSFLSSFLVPKKVCKSFTSRCVFCNVALFSCSAIKLSTEPTSTNLSDILKIKRRLASFRAICLLCSDWLGGSILDAGWLYFSHVKKLYVKLIGRIAFFTCEIKEIQNSICNVYYLKFSLYI